MQISVATVQTDTNTFTDRVIIAPVKGDSVNLDACPRGTVDVHTFNSMKAAAAFMGRSESTVRRQLRQAEADEREKDAYYESIYI